MRSGTKRNSYCGGGLLRIKPGSHKASAYTNSRIKRGLYNKRIISAADGHSLIIYYFRNDQHFFPNKYDYFIIVMAVNKISGYTPRIKVINTRGASPPALRNFFSKAKEFLIIMTILYDLFVG